MGDAVGYSRVGPLEVPGAMCYDGDADCRCVGSVAVGGSVVREDMSVSSKDCWNPAWSDFGLVVCTYVWGTGKG